MYETAKKSRAANKAKAERLANRPIERVDSSDWTPPPLLNADVKTGMRPVSKQALRRGGKVHGSAPKARADRKARKAGGNIAEQWVNRDAKKANEERAGIKHDGALKHGGRTHKKDGGFLNKLPWKPVSAEEHAADERQAAEGRRAHGGRASEKLSKSAKAVRAKHKAGGKVHLDAAEDKAMIKSMVKKSALRGKKADGGPMGADPRLSIVSPKAMEFGQNVVTPGLKKGGRTAKAVGGPLVRSMPAAVGSGVASSGAGMSMGAPASRASSVARGVPFQPGGRFASQPAPVGGGMASMPAPVSGGMVSQPAPIGGAPTNMIGLAGGAPTGMMAPAGGAPTNMMAPAGGAPTNMIGMPPQAMANARGVPFRGGSFSPPGLARRPSIGAPTNALPSVASSGGVSSMPAPVGGGMASMPAPLGAPTSGGFTSQPAPLGAPVGGGFASQPAPLGAPTFYSPLARTGGFARGGRTNNKKAKGKTNINIVIAQAPHDQDGMQQMPPQQAGNAIPPVGGQQPMPQMPPQMPPQPPMGGQPPMPFKKGGRVSQVAKSYKDMTAGAGSGEGRLQKTDIAKRAPHKAGGKVYRSYKDMDAGAGSGRGRLEKTEIESRKSRKG